MAELNLVKVGDGILQAADLETAAVINTTKQNAVLHGEFKKCRNPQFLRKFFALLRVGFDLWEPGELNTKYGKPEKSFKQYRAQVTVLAGHYETVFNLDGSFRLIPKSISFASMEAEEFAELYSSVINIILKNIPATFSKADLDEQVEILMGFA